MILINQTGYLAIEVHQKRAIVYLYEHFVSVSFMWQITLVAVFCSCYSWC